MLKIRSGIGYDLHKVKSGGNGLYIGGIMISDTLSFQAHSDGDVVIHALIDSLLGAMGEKDIGELFPNTDPQYKGIGSEVLLRETLSFLHDHRYEIMNIDCVVVAEKPPLAPFKNQIRTHVAQLLNIPAENFNIKAKTKEKVDAVGRGEAIECFCISLIRHVD
jgi:2-C-methyl-D-erythritol 4-phosphate cytidylyltransferase/2-C-methyl-D-erythritol 2,4-cyclodiphosphate synthase